MTKISSKHNMDTENCSPVQTYVRSEKNAQATIINSSSAGIPWRN